MSVKSHGYIGQHNTTLFQRHAMLHNCTSKRVLFFKIPLVNHVRRRTNEEKGSCTYWFHEPGPCCRNVQLSLLRKFFVCFEMAHNVAEHHWKDSCVLFMNSSIKFLLCVLFLHMAVPSMDYRRFAKIMGKNCKKIISRKIARLHKKISIARLFMHVVNLMSVREFSPVILLKASSASMLHIMRYAINVTCLAYLKFHLSCLIPHLTGFHQKKEHYPAKKSFNDTGKPKRRLTLSATGLGATAGGMQSELRGDRLWKRWKEKRPIRPFSRRKCTINFHVVHRTIKCNIFSKFLLKCISKFILCSVRLQE